MPLQEFEELYKTYYPQVYRYILKLCRDEMLAEEITQETFFKVLKNADGFRAQCKFSVWMCQIAKNTLYTYLKKKRYLADIAIETLPLESEDNIEQLIADKDMARKIHEILHFIEEPYHEVFWMRTFEELSFAEIARIHGKSESWARVTYHRAKMKIKEELT
jgi:RNA polymerase sigma-70 factor (ECF subfamily)